MKKLYKLLLISLLILNGGNAMKAQSYNNDDSKSSSRAITPTYISKIAVAYGDEASTPKNILNNQGFTIIDYDLNKGCGSTSHYIYMGYKTTTNPAEAITGIFFRKGNNPPNYDTFDGVTAYLLGESNETNPGEDKAVDLNVDAGGDYIYTYVTRNTSRAAVLDGLYFDGSSSASGYVTPNVNLNSGTKGGAIYLHYKQFSGKASATFHYLNSSGSRTSSTTSVSVKHHQQAVNNTPSAPTSVTYDGRTWTLLGWREDNNATTAGSNPSYTYMDSKVYRAVYSADVSLTYNANGGSNTPSKQTAKQYVNAGSSSIAKSNTSFTIPSTTPTHDATKCNFAGWGTSSSSTTEYQAGGSISINTNTTLYAVWPEHNGTQTYVNNGSNHTYTWSCCQKSVTEDHIYDNGIDNYCGAHIHKIDGNGYCNLCDGYPAELVNGYYEIYNADNLFWFAEYVNTIDKTASAKLMNDIDLENRPWTPIGTTGESSHNFRGHFDGNGKTITGLNVTVTRNGGGFFGEVRLGTVEDFTIYGEVKLNGKHSYVGGVIGSAPGANSNKPEHNGATIRNITSYVNVTLGEGSHGSNHVAGFIGYANHETLIENCTWYGTLDLDAYRAQDGVGGLVGKANDNSAVTIRNCAAYGTIKTSYKSGSYNSHNNIYIGGIVSNSVASAQTTLENCIWAGTLIDNTNLDSNAHISAIGTLNGIKSVSNCYALDNMPYITTNNAHNTGITKVTAGQLASGEIAYKLQGTQATQIWGQNIDNGETKETLPVLGGAKVYCYEFDSNSIYTNNEFELAPHGKCGDNLYWNVTNNTLTIFGTGAMNDYDNSGNKAPWRSLSTAPTSLVLEDGITHIGNYAFRDCSGFKGSLTIPNSVTTIGKYAFYNCIGFTGSLTIPNSVTSIGNHAFRNCSGFTGDLTIGNSVTTIGNSAFIDCSGFTEVYSLAKTAPTLGTKAFTGTNSNAILYYPALSKLSYEEKGWFNYFPQHIGLFDGKCGDNLYWGVNDNVLTISGTGAMYDYDNIDNKAPWRSLNPAPTSLVLEEGITHIGNFAFYGCDGFTEVHSSAVIAPTLGTEVFANINENAILCHPVSSEPSYEEKGWFEYFRQHVEADGQCGDNLFWYVDDENILTIFGTGAMYDYGSDNNKARWRNLYPAPKSLILEEGITHIGNSAFHGCSSFTGSLTIPNSVTTIGVSAFDNCPGFTGDLTIPNNVTSIGKTAFWACKGFTGSLTIPNSVTTIGDYAFQFCDGFTEVYSLAETAPTLGTSVFSGISSDATLYYLTSSEQSYNDKGWFNYFPQHIGLFDGKCGDNLYWVVIDNVLTISGTGAMYDYEYNGDNFSPWRKLETAPTSLLLEEGVTHIGNYAFQDCSSFTEVYSFAETAPTLGTNTFTGANSNAILYYPASSEPSYDDKGWFNYFPQHIGFNGQCGDNLYWRVDDDNTLTIFGTGAMYDYDNIDNKAPWRSLNPAPKSLVLEEGIIYLGNYAFQDCSGFTEVYSLAETAPALETSAFTGINNNAILYYPASSEQSYDDKGWFNYFSKCIGFNGKCGDNLYWHVDNENTLTIFGTGAMYDYNSYGSNISPWNNLGTAPTSLVLEEGITTIGDNAFYNCFKFTGSLTIPNSVTTIGDYAFAYCEGFTGSLTIPNSVTTIGNNAFYICIYFNEVHSLAETAPTLGNDAFSYINKNATLYYPASSEQSYEEEGWFGYFSKHFGFGKCGENLYWSVDDKNALTIFGTGAMYDFDSNDTPWKNLNPAPTSLVLKEGITYIGKYAFYECYDLTDVHSSAVTAPTLGTDAFANINENATLYYPSLSEHSYEAEGWFNYFQQLIGLNGKCGENLYWYVNDENTLTIFGSGNMWDYDNSGNNISPWRKLETSPTSLVLKEGITHIGIYAFENCSGFTGSLTIPNSVTSIGESAFYNCSGFTGSLTIPNSVTCIRYGTFYNCSGFNGSLTIPNSVNYIEQVAFRGCSGFTGTLTIGNSVTTIKDYAFYQCSGFTGSLTIPNSVTYIGDEAFYNCSGFTDIFFYRDANPTIATSAFFYINAKVCVPVIWESFDNIPEDKLVKMATFVGEQSADASTGSATINGWVGLAEDQTWPDEDDHVAINASLVLGQQTTDNRLWVKSFGYCGDGTTVNGSITIEDGGQLYCEVARGEVTVKKEILGYQQSAVSGQQSESESETKWYTIASPLKDTIQIIPNSSFITPNSDLYRYDEPSHTWQNAKNSANNGFNTIDPGRGYLYANAENTTLEFKGNINTETVTYNLTAKSDVLKGFHLVGNPFTHDITFAHLNATEDASLVNGYYVLNGEGAWGATLGSNEEDIIKVGQGILVKATAEGTLAIVKTQSRKDAESQSRGQQTTDNGQQSLCISVSNAKYSDRAFVVFDKGVGLDKMNHENEDIPLLYIPMEDADYAIAMMDINVNEIPVNFETNVMGEYTISLRQENCEFDELYLLDKETDEKVNILEQDYTFIATSNENPERFILMKNAQGSQLEAHSHFAYINNGDIVIYNIEGDANIKIFDALGRCVYQGESSDETTRIANGYSSGVYMIQKVDDNGVKVQKVMID